MGKKYLKASELVRGEWYVFYSNLTKATCLSRVSKITYEIVVDKEYDIDSCIDDELLYMGWSKGSKIRKPTNKELKKIIELKPDWFEVKVEDCVDGEYYFVMTNDGEVWIIKGDPLGCNCDSCAISSGNTYRTGTLVEEAHEIKYIRKALPKEIKKFNRAFGNTCGNCDKCRCEIMDKAKQVSEVMADISKLEHHTHTDEPEKILCVNAQGYDRVVIDLK